MQAARTMVIVDDTRLARMMIRGLVSQTSPDWTMLAAQDGSAAPGPGCRPRLYPETHYRGQNLDVSCPRGTRPCVT